MKTRLVTTLLAAIVACASVSAFAQDTTAASPDPATKSAPAKPMKTMKKHHRHHAKKKAADTAAPAAPAAPKG